jgi:hypothetical protein
MRARPPVPRSDPRARASWPGKTVAAISGNKLYCLMTRGFRATLEIADCCWNPHFSGTFWLFLPLKSAEREQKCRCRMHGQQYAWPYCRLLHGQCHWAIMGFLLHGAKVYGDGKEAYQQRPAYGINQPAESLSAGCWSSSACPPPAAGGACQDVVSPVSGWARGARFLMPPSLS